MSVPAWGDPILWGVITWYTALAGAALYCGGEYDPGEAWIALPIEAYTSGAVQCGDLFAVWSDGELVYLPARDAGPFGPYCVRRDGACEDIVADLPRHVYPGEGLSAPAYIVHAQPYRDRMELER